MQRVIPDGRRAPLSGACRALTAILLFAGSGMSTAVLAQGTSLPTTSTLGLLAAPVGHRQPRAQDLPPDVLRDEGMTRQPPEHATTLPDASHDRGGTGDPGMPLGDHDLRICRQC
jgi:hypothetical protein